jgi:hypothetical protein
MNDYDTLLHSVSAIAEQMQGLQAVAVAQYTPVVETIIATRSRDVRQIEQTLDGLLDFCGHEQALLLCRRLCRHYFDIVPAATAGYINAVEFLGIWKRVHNPTFNYGEFAAIKSQAGLKSTSLAAKKTSLWQWHM